MTLRTRIAAGGLAAVAALSPTIPLGAVATGAAVGIVGGTAVGIAFADEADAAAGVVRNTCQGSGGVIRTGNTSTTVTWNLGCNSARYANFVSANLPFKVTDANTGAVRTYYGGTVVNVSNRNVLVNTL